ncbi:MAG TPA: hypothetical protein VG125_01025 [Pirellulales bacterium]|jgi:hypothetical protein|nr:hypothetical protein [Pirellulales bacterium]
MPTHYLLPCPCGKKTEIDSSQAGLSVRCACGAELAVPTMRGLAALQRVESEPRDVPSEPARDWGAQQGLIFLGSTIVVVAALGAFGFWWFKMPQPLTVDVNYKENHRAFIDQVWQQSPEELIPIWQDFRDGIEKEQIEKMLDRYDALVAEVLGWEKVCAGVGAVGLVLVAVGLFTRAGPPARTLTPARVAQ